MAISGASLTGGSVSLLLAAVVLCFDVPHLLTPGARAHAGSAGYGHSASRENSGFHVTATIENAGHGEKRLTVRLYFGPGERDEDKAL